MWVKYSGVCWSRDSKGVFYSRYDIPKSVQAANLTNKQEVINKLGTETDKNQNMKLFYHRIGQPQEKDVMLFEYINVPEALISAQLTHDGDFLLISIDKGNEGQRLLYYADLREKANRLLKQELKVHPVVTEWIATYYYIHTFDEQFFFQTDFKASMQKVVTFNIKEPDMENWVDVVPENPSTVLQ